MFIGCFLLTLFLWVYNRMWRAIFEIRTLRRISNISLRDSWSFSYILIFNHLFLNIASSTVTTMMGCFFATLFLRVCNRMWRAIFRVRTLLFPLRLSKFSLFIYLYFYLAVSSCILLLSYICLVPLLSVVSLGCGKLSSEVEVCIKILPASLELMKFLVFLCFF